MLPARKLAAARPVPLCWIKRAGAAAAALLLAACAAQPAGDRAGAAACPAEGEWFVPGAGRFEARPLLARLARDSRVVLLGETHDNVAHHRWQLEVIRALDVERAGRVVIGLEMLPRRMQPVLDRWIAGGIAAADLERELDWARLWGIDFALYRPILDYTRERGLPLVALNIERAVVRAVSARGFAALGTGEREGLSAPAPPTPAYRERLFASYAAHQRPGASAPARDSPGFGRFVEAQQVWDRAMAEAIAAALRRDPARLVVALAGAGHVEGGDGIAHQLADLGVTAVAGLLPWDSTRADCATLRPGYAQAVFGIAGR